MSANVNNERTVIVKKKNELLLMNLKCKETSSSDMEALGRCVGWRWEKCL